MGTGHGLELVNKDLELRAEGEILEDAMGAPIIVQKYRFLSVLTEAYVVKHK